MGKITYSTLELQQILDDSFNHININEKGAPEGVATLDENGKVPLSQIPGSVIGQVEYMGVWDALTNSPLLSDPTTVRGNYYIVNVAGTQFTIDFEVGDWVISNGTTWDKVDNTDAVRSVNGYTGEVVLEKADLDLENVDNTSDLDKPVSTATQDLIDALTTADIDISTDRNYVTDAQLVNIDTINDRVLKTGDTMTGTLIVKDNGGLDTFFHGQVADNANDYIKIGNATGVAGMLIPVFSSRSDGSAWLQVNDSDHSGVPGDEKVPGNIPSLVYVARAHDSVNLSQPGVSFDTRNYNNTGEIEYRPLFGFSSFNKLYFRYWHKHGLTIGTYNKHPKGRLHLGLLNNGTAKPAIYLEPCANQVIPVPDTIEYDGSYLYYTDSLGNRITLGEVTTQSILDAIGDGSVIYAQYLPSDLVYDSSYVHTDNNYDDTAVTKLAGIDTLLTGGTLGQALTSNGNGTAPIWTSVSGAIERRSDWVEPFSYCGTATLGSLTSASVWRIARIMVNNDGSVTTLNATNVKWDDRYIVIYS